MLRRSRMRPSRWWRRSTATRSAADWSSPWPATTVSRPPPRRWGSRKCCSESFPAPAARSACRGLRRRRWRSRCAPTASRSRRRERWPPGWSTRSSRAICSPARSRSQRKAARRDVRRTREIVISADAVAQGLRGLRDHARLAEEDRPRRARAHTPRSTPSKPACSSAFDEGSMREIELFADCVVSTESGAASAVLRRTRSGEDSRRAEGHAGRSKSSARPSSAPARWAAASP